MDKTTKNVILVMILIILLVSAYFTVNYIKNDNKFNFNNNMTIQDTNRNMTPPSMNQNKDDKSDNVTDSNDNTKDTTNDSSRPSMNRDRSKKENFNRNNVTSINSQRHHSNNLFYLLYGIESACAGAIILYLVLSNIEKEDKKKITNVKLTK